MSSRSSQSITSEPITARSEDNETSIGRAQTIDPAATRDPTPITSEQKTEGPDEDTQKGRQYARYRNSTLNSFPITQSNDDDFWAAF